MSKKQLVQQSMWVQQVSAILHIRPGSLLLRAERAALLNFSERGGTHMRHSAGSEGWQQKASSTVSSLVVSGCITINSQLTLKWSSLHSNPVCIRWSGDSRSTAGYAIVSDATLQPLAASNQQYNQSMGSAVRFLVVGLHTYVNCLVNARNSDL